MSEISVDKVNFSVTDIFSMKNSYTASPQEIADGIKKYKEETKKKR